jgi:serine/threonine protein kinase/Tol biopolymer transport system component
MSVTPERWQRVSAIFEAVVERPVAERPDFLATLCGDDAELHREVAALLDEDALTSPLDQPVSVAARTLTDGTLVTGSRVGSYLVEAVVGAGGMGEVYRARDVHLDRQAALKVLPARFADDPERVARFKREAQLLAALNHPHIAGIYGLEEASGVRALALEYVDGPTLADRIARGPLGLEEAMTIARQITDALEAAHGQGIIHRDLKPANIKIAANGGAVKVLDFGLARLAQLEAVSPADATTSPTIASPAMTAAGIILGTAAYMAPEQARAKPADKRSDIWAFGCLLYETLTGKRAFAGDDVSETLANVLKSPPDWSALPALTPPAIRRLLRRCLEKDRSRRLSDIADARLELEEALTYRDGDSYAVESPAPVIRSWKTYALWVAASFAVGVLTAGLFLDTQGTPPVQASRQLGVTFGTDAPLRVTQSTSLALSPDGTMVAFVTDRNGANELYLRRFDELQATRIVTDANNPFFSPDSRWLAFFSSDGQMKKISTAGGAPIAIEDSANLAAGIGRGASWGDDGYIVYNPLPTERAPLLRISSDGGAAERLSELGGDEVAHRWPQVLPGAKAVLFTAMRSTNATDDAKVVVKTLPNGVSKVLQHGATWGRYLHSGHLAYIQEGVVFVVPFDLPSLSITGPPVRLLENVLTRSSGAAWFEVANDGTMVYVAGDSGGNEVPLLWLQGDGGTTAALSKPLDWRHPTFSPDGSRLAFNVEDGRQSDVWLYDFNRDALARSTFDPANDTLPVWSPDGRTIVFASSRGGTTSLNLYWQAADGTGVAHRLTSSVRNQRPTSWHPSGKYIVYAEEISPSQHTLMTLAVERSAAGEWKAGAPTVFLAAKGAAVSAAFSPDGKWIAYQSNETGTIEVFVRPFPRGEGRWQISASGGRTPTWSRASPELFYLAADRRLMKVSYTIDGASFAASAPERWSEATIDSRPGQRWFDLHPDGKRVIASPARSTALDVRTMVLVSNVFEDLRRRASLQR